MAPGTGPRRSRFGELLRRLRVGKMLDYRRLAQKLIAHGYRAPPSTRDPARWLAGRIKKLEELDPAAPVPSDVDVVELADAVDGVFPGTGHDLLRAFGEDELERRGLDPDLLRP